MDDKNPIMKDFEKNYIELTAQRIADIASEKIIKTIEDKTKDQSVLYEIHEKRLRRLEETVFNGLLDKVKSLSQLWWKVLIGIGIIMGAEILLKHFKIF